MAMANVQSKAAYRQTQRSSLQPGLRVGGHLALTDFRPDDPKWTFAYGTRHIDSTINIILGLLLLIIIKEQMLFDDARKSEVIGRRVSWLPACRSRQTKTPTPNWTPRFCPKQFCI